MEFERLSFVETIEALAEKLGLQIPREVSQRQTKKTSPDHYELLDHSATFYQKQLKQHPDAPKFVDYLKQRGITGEIAKKFQIGFAPAGWDNLLKQFSRAREGLLITGMLIKNDKGRYYDRFRERVMFPIRDRRGRVIGFGGRVLGDEQPKYLNSPETPLFHKGKELYGLYEALQAHRELKQAIIVEGYMDVVALAQHGIDYAMATLGTSTSKDHLQSLLRYTNKVVFCFDGDKAGKAAAWRGLENSLEILRDGVQIRFMFLPEGEDPDSLIRKEQHDEFVKRIDNAMTLEDFLFAHLYKEIDVTGMDGKAGLVKLASPLLRRIPDGAFKHMLLEQLGRRVRIDVDRLKGLIEPAEKTNESPPSKPQNNRRAPSSMRLAITLLLQNPNLASTVPEDIDLSVIHGPGSDLLKELLHLLHHTPTRTTGALLEHWRSKDNFQQLSTLASSAHHVPEDGLEAEFAGTLKRLVSQSRAITIERLLAKVNAEGLDLDERKQLQDLIRSQKRVNTTKSATD